MTTGRPARRERIELRATSEEKELLVAAAAAEHSDLTSFVMRTALAAAEERMAHRERITLTREGGDRLLALLDQPAPEPTPALREASRRYRARRLD